MTRLNHRILPIIDTGYNAFVLSIKYPLISLSEHVYYEAYVWGKFYLLFSVVIKLKYVRDSIFLKKNYYNILNN